MMQMETEKGFFWRGIKCRIKIGPVGNLNGYAGVSHSHPWHGKGYDQELCGHKGCWEHSLGSGIDVHGGLTYAGEGWWKDGLWYFGFDTAHAGDNIPQLHAKGEDWDSEKVGLELRRLAEQLNLIKENKP